MDIEWNHRKRQFIKILVTFFNALMKLKITTMMIKGSIKRMIMHYPHTTWVWRKKFKTIYAGHVSNGNKKKSIIVHNFATHISKFRS
jgi:hypothetical protein